MRDLTATWEAGLAKIWAWDAGFFRLFVGNSGNRHDPNKRSSWLKSLVSPFKPNYRVCLLIVILLKLPESFLLRPDARNDSY